MKTNEFESKVSASGGIILLLTLSTLAGAGFLGFFGSTPIVVLATIVGIFALICLSGFYILEPNQSAVILFFGKYKGTDTTNGLRWIPPFHESRKVSLKTCNFESERLKVSDSMGNPIEFAAVVSYRVKSSAQAVFDVDDYEDFAEIQSEAGLRDTVGSYPYDHSDENNDSNEITLRGNSDEVTNKLKEEVQSRLTEAGIEVIEVRITHLAYAPEIAHAMLQRQQATALVAARSKVVTGSIGIIEDALKAIEKKKLGNLEDKDKNAIIGNMLLVLAGDSNAQPVINTQSTK